jgi:hypothetical protein
MSAITEEVWVSVHSTHSRWWLPYMENKMTPTELIAIATERHGSEWKGKMADETGWGWHTFNRIEKGGKVSDKLAKSVLNLKPRKPRA